MWVGRIYNFSVVNLSFTSHIHTFTNLIVMRENNNKFAFGSLANFPAALNLNVQM